MEMVSYDPVAMYINKMVLTVLKVRFFVSQHIMVIITFNKF